MLFHFYTWANLTNFDEEAINGFYYPEALERKKRRKIRSRNGLLVARNPSHCILTPEVRVNCN